MTIIGSLLPTAVPTVQDVRDELGLLPQPVAYALAFLAAVILVAVALKVIRKVVGKIIGVVVSVLISVGLKLYLADPGFHTWLISVIS